MLKKIFFCGKCETQKKKEIHAFIQQGFIKWVKSVSKDIYNVTKYFYFQ